jgi:hypothetical protein
MQGQLGWEFLCKRGTAAAKITTSFGGEKKIIFFLSMHLYPFLNVVGCVWMLDVLILAPFFG